MRLKRLGGRLLKYAAVSHVLPSARWSHVKRHATDRFPKRRIPDLPDGRDTNDNFNKKILMSPVCCYAIRVAEERERRCRHWTPPQTANQPSTNDVRTTMMYTCFVENPAETARRTRESLIIVSLSTAVGQRMCFGEVTDSIFPSKGNRRDFRLRPIDSRHPNRMFDS